GLDSFCLVNLTPVCVHTTNYTGEITLPIVPGGYTFAYQRCCRNETISNIIDPLQTGATFLIRINDAAIARANNSPEYKQWPPIYICANEPLVFDHGALDMDGDSLVYKLCTPFEGGTIGDPQPIPTDPPPYDTVVWRPAYNLNNLLGTGEPLVIDPETGIMTARPGSLGQFVVGVCVEEYDRETGELLSVLRRDFQYNVNECENISAEFEAPDAQCDDFRVVLENVSTGATTYEWYADGQLFSTTDSTLVSQTFPDTGTYSVELIAVPNTICADTFRQEIFLQLNSIVPDFFQVALSCVDSAILQITDLSLDSISIISSYEWTVEYGGQMQVLDGPSPNFIVPLGASGTITLVIQNENGCEQTLIRPFDTDLENPTDFILPNVDACPGEGVALNPDAPAGLNFNYEWSPAEFLDDPNAQNPIATVDQTTEFTVVITNDISGCEATLSSTVTVQDAPVADFDFETECGGVTYTFTSNSPTATNFFYDFGVEGTDADTSNLANPSFTFPEAGPYTVTFIATNASGCTDTATQTVFVVVDNPIGLAVENSASTCEVTYTIAPMASETVTFTYFDEVGNQIGTGDSLQLEVSGVRQIRVVATLPNGCFEEETVTITGGAVNISVPDTVLSCGLAGLSFGVQNLDANDTLTYLWSPAELFDPNTIELATPTFIGPFGEHEVSVLVVNQFNCFEIQEVLLVVLDDQSTFSFTFAPQCNGNTIDFTNTSTATFGYLWDFGGEGTSTEANPSFTFPGPGTYPVTLSSPYNIDCIDPVTMDVTVTESVLDADFSVQDSECLDGMVRIDFIEAVFNATGSPLTYNWTFTTAEPATSMEENPSVIVSQSGDLMVSLMVETNDGCTASFDTVINVQIPTIGLPEEITICPGDSTALNPGFDDELVYTWTPTIGFDPNDPNPTVSDAGTFIVTATTDIGDINCVATDTVTVIVTDSIEIVLTDGDGTIINDGGAGGNGNGEIELPTIVTCGEPVEVIAEVNSNLDVVFTDPDGNVLSTGTTITINVDGRDTVIVTATDEFGCMAMDTIVIINQQVDAEPNVMGGNISLCETQDTLLGVINLDPADTLTYQWEDNPIINGPLDGPTVEITPTGGTTEIDVVVTNQFGCDTTITFSVEITPFMPNQFPSPLDVCFEEPFDIDPNDEINPDLEYEWEPPLPDPNNVVLQDTTVYSVTITDPSTGCFDVQMITVNVAPEIGLEGEPISETLCEPGSVTFTTTNLIGAEVTWYSDPDLTDVLATGDTYTVELNTPGTITVFAQAVDPISGCTEEQMFTATLVEFMPPMYPPTLQACFGQPTVIEPTGGVPVDGYEYEWDPEIVPGGPMPTVTLEEDQTYSVTITDPASGCESIQSVMVEVSEDQNVMVSPLDTTLCEPGSYTVTSTTDIDSEITWYSDEERTNQIGTGNSIEITVNEPGTVTIYGVFVDPATGCEEEQTVTATLTELSSGLPAESVEGCAGGAAPGLFPDGTNPAFEYSFEPMELVDLSDPNNPTWAGDGSGTVTTTVTDPSTGCTATV
ncbi:MAG: PKD domain-containing protein, partial [Bacteroidota bacterium]